MSDYSQQKCPKCGFGAYDAGVPIVKYAGRGMGMTNSTGYSRAPSRNYSSGNLDYSGSSSKYTAMK